MKGKIFHYPYVSLIRVLDGDTIEVKVDLGMSIFTEQYIRLYGIQAPELRDPGGVEAKLFLETLLPATGYFGLTTFKPVRGNKDKKGKYGRYLGMIKITLYNEMVNDTTVNDIMVREGYAIKKLY